MEGRDGGEIITRREGGRGGGAHNCDPPRSEISTSLTGTISSPDLNVRLPVARPPPPRLLQLSANSAVLHPGCFLVLFSAAYPTFVPIMQRQLLFSVCLTQSPTLCGLD